MEKKTVLSRKTSPIAPTRTPAAAAPAKQVPYVALGPRVLRGGVLICGARSNNTARLISNALNVYKPNRRGV